MPMNIRVAARVQALPTERNRVSADRWPAVAGATSSANFERRLLSTGKLFSEMRDYEQCLVGLPVFCSICVGEVITFLKLEHF